ncbi:MAG: nucleotidyltransferase family protein [Dehalococcoidia bacterium]
MRRDDVLRVLGEHKGEFARFGVKSLSIFGSVARDEARDDSDLDVLVEFEGPTKFQPYMDLKFFLEEILGCRVDVATLAMLRPELSPTIERDLHRVA